MPKNFRFWGNVALIAIAHAAIIVGLMRWSRAEKDAGAQSIVWMSGGGGDGLVTEKKNLPAPTKAPRKESKTEALKDRDSGEDRPLLTSAPSEIQLPTPKASPARTPSPTATATPVRTPKPKPKETPTPTPAHTPKPKPTPKPTPKSSPKKIVMAKASPKPTPAIKPSPEKVEKEESETEPEKKEIAKAVPIPVKDDSAEKESKKSAAIQTGSGKGTTSGTGGGRAGGSASEGQFSWYGSMLHDRFYSEWVQPTNVASAGAKSSVLVKLRIEKDGSISNFEVVRPSGNSELDDSVKALAGRVSRVEPLPEGLGKGDHYDVKINFELNSE
jgi:TonB family protein